MMTPVPDASASSRTLLDNDLGSVEYRNVSLLYRDGTLTVDDVSLRVGRNEFVAVVGPSGCGKSTMLNLAAGLLTPSTGRVAFEGRPIDGPNIRAGYVTQKDLLLPWRTVAQNVAVPLRVRGYSPAARAARVTEVLAQVGLTGYEDYYPSQLSGGMRKRCSIARTLSYEPATYLMDEPFGSLDAQLRMTMHAEVLELHRSTGAAFLLVTHDLTEAITLADRVIVMSAKPASIVAEMQIDIERPRNVHSVQRHPDFHDYFDTLWQALLPGLGAATSVNGGV